LSLIFNNWDYMPTDIKQSASDEVAQYARRSEGYEHLMALARHLNPELGFALTMHVIKSVIDVQHDADELKKAKESKDKASSSESSSSV